MQRALLRAQPGLSRTHRFPGAYALRRDAVGVLTELTIPKRNLALLSSPALAPAVGTLFTDVLAACGDHATQVGGV
jgi:hypothetical protein